MATKAKSKATQPKKSLEIKAWWIHTLYIVALLFVIVKVYKQVYDEKLYLGGDNAVYYITAKSLMKGEGYTSIHLPSKEPANHYPPGYPVISAGIMKIFGDDIEVMNKANGYFLFGSIVLLYFILINLTGNKHLSFVIALLSALNFHLLNFSTIAMSEIPFLFTSLATVFFLMRVNKEELSLKDYNLWLMIFFMMVSYYIRTAGLSLVGGVILYFLFERKWKLAGIVAGAFILLAVPWYVRSKSLGGGGYERQLMMINPYRPELGKMQAKDWVNRIQKNVKRYVSMEIPSAVLCYKIENYNKAKPEDRKWGAGIFLSLLGILGLFALKKYRWLVIAYLAGTAFIVALWPDAWYGTRFILPAIPFIYLLLILPVYEGLNWVTQKVKLGENLRLVILPFVFLAFIIVEKKGIIYLQTFAKGMMNPSYTNYFELAKFAKSSLPKDAVVVCRKPELFYLYADRTVTNFINSDNSDSLINNMKEVGATHLVIEQLGFGQTGRYLYPAVQKNPEKFKLVKQMKNPDTYLFEINHDRGYVGSIVNGKRNGKGRSSYADGTIYDGNWVEDKREGFGVFTWPNGMKFEGEFKNNVRYGKGIINMSDGSVLHATWVNDTIKGYGKLFSKECNLIQEGEMKNNNFVNKQGGKK